MGKGQTAGANEYLQKQIDEINTALTDVAIPLLLDQWSDNGDGTFTQVVTVNGLGEGAVPLITLNSVGDIATDDENYSYACISDVITSENTMTFIASRKPSISFTVVAKGVVAAENSTVADITALVGRVSELEEANSKLNSDIDTLKLRVGYLDYCGKNGDGYRINFPCQVAFSGNSYGVANISAFMPEGYGIDEDFPTIIATLNTTSGLVAIASCKRYSASQIYVQLNQNYTGDLTIAFGVRLRKSS